MPARGGEPSSTTLALVARAQPSARRRDGAQKLRVSEGPPPPAVPAFACAGLAPATSSAREQHQAGGGRRDPEQAGGPAGPRVDGDDDRAPPAREPPKDGRRAAEQRAPSPVGQREGDH